MQLYISVLLMSLLFEALRSFCSFQVKGQFDEYCGESPETTILTQCEKLNCDSIVMGSRGLSGFKKFLLGSCSSYVLNHAPVPVSIIPLKQSDEEQQKKQ
jgi:hypothetical protein